VPEDVKVAQGLPSEFCAEAEPSQVISIDQTEARNSGEAFDLGREDPRLRNRYGRHLMSQGLLLARRLVEAGHRGLSVPAPPGRATLWASGWPESL
jgi:hypothetical protein